ncbi:MAG: hypothetical protein ABI548_01765 [Polyangiaceae bacterium]
MSTSDQLSGAQGDQQFERLLLESARSDELSEDAVEFWARLSATIADAALISGAILGGAGMGPVAFAQAQRVLAMKWLTLGLVVGGALGVLATSTLHSQERAHAPPNPNLVASVRHSASAATGVSVVPPPASAASTLTPQEARRPPAAKGSGFGHGPRTSTLERRSAPVSVHSATSASDLSAQVTLVDAARAAIADQYFGEALRLSEQYRVRFPNGELGPEAELIAIEALAGTHERTRVLERAASFFVRFPGDPHTARVEWLAR